MTPVPAHSIFIEPRPVVLHIGPSHTGFNCRKTLMLAWHFSASGFSLFLASYIAPQCKANSNTLTTCISVAITLQVAQIAAAHIIPRIWRDM